MKGGGGKAGATSHAQGFEFWGSWAETVSFATKGRSKSLVTSIRGF